MQRGCGSSSYRAGYGQNLPPRPSRTGMVLVASHPNSRTDRCRYLTRKNFPAGMGGDSAQNSRFAFGSAQQSVRRGLFARGIPRLPNGLSRL